jgi:hypothetical protein
LFVRRVIEIIPIGHPNVRVSINAVELIQDVGMGEEVIPIDAKDNFLVLTAVDRVVEIGKSSLVLPIVDELHAGSKDRFFDNRFDFFVGVIGRTIIDIDDAEVVIVLLEDRAEIPLAESGVIIGGNDDDKGLLFLNRESAGGFFFFGF